MKMVVRGGSGGGWWFSMVQVLPVLLMVLQITRGSRWSAAAINVTEYLEQREEMLAQEQTMILGQDQVLNAKEQAVNDILMTAKISEMNYGFQTLDFPPSVNFMTVRDKIEASAVFQIIQQMPKGSALHLHDTALAAASWVVEEITYWPDLYMCYTQNDQLLLKFFETPSASCQWVLVSDMRAAAATPEEFDAMLFSRLSIFTPNPEDKYPDINSVWESFGSYFTAITDMLMYRPAWEAYLYQALHEYMIDNVLYIEFRGTLPPLYELSGSELTPEETLTVYQGTIQRFIQHNPNDYYGARYIYGPFRGVNNATVEGYVTLVKELKAKFPELVAGFDLVGQEDKGEPLINIIEPLLQLSEAGIPVFYHAGETTWMGMSTDDNLVDALLLNATRLGHGYAITKHPEAKTLALERNVPIEVCPISNQVLLLVEDLRNHPAAGLIAEGFPLVVSADDPGAWGVTGLSYDVYEVFMALGGAKADLRFLKQLAINSIMYSSLDEGSTSELMLRWVEKWDEFIDATLKLHSSTGRRLFPSTTVSHLHINNTPTPPPTPSNHLYNNNIID